VITDRRAIGEVVRALVDNALVHTAGTVRVTLTRVGRDAVLEVADEGPGVEPSVLTASLEEPFQPGDTSETRPAEGMGLSLYIAHRVVRNAGGRLEFETGPDRGTVARLCLPAASEG
jgi:signal transduction histidine kinase